MNSKLNITYIDSSMYDKKENITKSNYNLDDCVIIRTTDIFPKDKIIQTPIHGNAYGFGGSVIFREAIIRKIKQSYPNGVVSDEEDFLNKLNQYNLFFDIPRSTIHFTINGLVLSHLYGNFSNKPFIIIEPLKNHIDEKSLVGLRVEDTYFKDDVMLSNDAYIMISKTYFDAFKDNQEFILSLQDFNIIVFDGDEKKAVDFVIRSLGYNSFNINNHGYSEAFMKDNDETRMIKFIESLANKKGISQDRHCFSEIYKEDYDLMYKMVDKRERDFLLFVLDNAIITDDLNKQIIYELSNYFDITRLTNSKAIHKLVDMIGLDNLKKFITEFNQKCVLEVTDNIGNYTI